MASGRCELTGKYCPSLDIHHVVPREAGGINGPTINLSPEIHQTLHRCKNNPRLTEEFISSLPNNVSRALAKRLIDTIRESKAIDTDEMSIKINLPKLVHFKLSVKASELNMSVPKFIAHLLEGIVK